MIPDPTTASKRKKVPSNSEVKRLLALNAELEREVLLLPRIETFFFNEGGLTPTP